MDSQPVFGARPGVQHGPRPHRLLRRCLSCPRCRRTPSASPTGSAGRVLTKFVPITFTALKTAMPAAERCLRLAARRRRPPGRVPAAALRAGHVRRSPDAGRAPARGREAVGEAPQRPGPVHVRRGPGAAAHRGRQGAPRRGLGAGAGHGSRDGTTQPAGTGGARLHPRNARRRVRGPSPCACTGSCATSTASPASGDCWRTRSAAAPSCRRSPTRASSGWRSGGSRRGRSAPASTRSWPTSAATRHVVVGRSACRGARPRRRGVPGVRRHDPLRQLLQLHRRLLPDLRDRRQVLADNTTSKFLK